MQASAAHVQAQLARLVAGPDSPFFTPPPAGLMRGIDFYRMPGLVRAMIGAVHFFHRTQHHFPDLIDPQGFNARIVRRKFFEPLKVPESGNKLRTKDFLPAGLEGVRCAHMLWHARQAILPPNDAIAPGVYFLKANHGSSMNVEVRYPLDAATRAALERRAADWLRHPFGIQWGEWWYNAFPRQILLEEHLGADRLSFNFFCFRGRVALIDFFDKKTSELISLRPDLSLVGHEFPRRSVADICTRDDIARMAAIASAISQSQDFVRVDLFLKDDGEIILGEISFSPGNAISQRPDPLDDELGRAWAEAISARPSPANT